MLRGGVTAYVTPAYAAYQRSPYVAGVRCRIFYAVQTV